MKRIMFILLIAALSLTSCQKTGESARVVAGTEGVVQTPEDTALAQTAVAKAFVIRQPGYFYDIEEKNGVKYMSKYIDAIDIGLAVDILDAIPIEMKTAEADKNPLTFVRISWEGTVGYTSLYNIASTDKLAVVLGESASLYSGARNGAVMNSKVPGMTVVAILEEKDGFARVSFYDPEIGFVPWNANNQRWLTLASLDTATQNLEAVCLFKKYQVTELKYGNKKLELLKIVISSYANSIVAPMATGEAAKMGAVKKGGATVYAEASASSAPVTNGALKESIGVTIAEAVSSVSGESWYKISEPIGGFVAAKEIETIQ